MCVRRWISILMNLALALTFVQAPFLHVHRHEVTQRHRHGFFHAHFPHLHPLHSDSPGVRGFDPDDDAVYQQWFSATTVDTVTPVYLVSTAHTFTPKWTSEPNFDAEIQSGHDPPRRSRSTP